MGEKGFFILFGGLSIGFFVARVQGTTLSNTASSSPGTATTESERAIGNTSRADDGSSNASYTPPPRYGTTQNTYISNRDDVENKSNTEIQAELEDLYDELWELEQRVDSALRRQPESRYSDYVRLSRSAATSEDPDREYLTLTLDRSAGPVNISSWYVESYVTEKRMALPNGTKIYRDGGVLNQTRPIILQPGGRAFLITGDSPVNVSFQENMCTGYLREHERFYPNTNYNCPRPIELMERYADIDLDDDSCYDFVNQVGRCRMIQEDDPRLDDLSGRCERFVKEYLNYNSCVDAFSWRTDFHNDDDWYIYFERDEERWRRKREIIRLMDQYDEVIAVLEY